MKYLATLFLLSSTLLFSHSAEVGYFYSDHKEPDYTYNLGGIVVSYTVGNPLGLNASTRSWISNDSDLLLVKSRNTLLYRIPAWSLVVVPFFGMQSIYHMVYEDQNYSRSILKTFHFGGVGINKTVGDFTGTIGFGHLHNLTYSFVHNESDSFFGESFKKVHQYALMGKVGYKINDVVSFIAMGDYERAYKEKSRTWSADITAKIRF